MRRVRVPDKTGDWSDPRRFSNCFFGCRVVLPRHAHNPFGGTPCTAPLWTRVLGCLIFVGGRCYDQRRFDQTDCERSRYYTESCCQRSQGNRRSYSRLTKEEGRYDPRLGFGYFSRFPPESSRWRQSSEQEKDPHPCHEGAPVQGSKGSEAGGQEGEMNMTVRNRR
jgi:hypothetical protein